MLVFLWVFICSDHKRDKQADSIRLRLACDILLTGADDDDEWIVGE